VIGISCSPKTKEITTQKQDESFILTMEFYPSFISHCRISLINNDTEKTLSIDNFYFNPKIRS